MGSDATFLYISQMTLVPALFMHPTWDARPIRSYSLKFHRERVPTIKVEHPTMWDVLRSSGDMGKSQFRLEL
jgi:hypothetical protein